MFESINNIEKKATKEITRLLIRLVKKNGGAIEPDGLNLAFVLPSTGRKKIRTVLYRITKVYVLSFRKEGTNLYIDTENPSGEQEEFLPEYLSFDNLCRLARALADCTGEKRRYTVWPDSESRESIYKDFDDAGEAHDFASAFVHRFDGQDAERVILHIDDNKTGQTIDTVENINKCDARP